MPERIAKEDGYFSKLRLLMDILRQECPWDKKQTIQGLRPYTLEEVHEVLEAVDHAVESDDWRMLEDELGDLLLQVVFYACIAEEQHKFSIESIVDRLIEKMIYRHPHVFSDARPADVVEQWEQLKDAKHTERKSRMDGIPPLPALSYAKKQQSRAARVGFDWNAPELVIDKMYEELGEFADEVRMSHTGANNRQQLEDELGDVLFTVVNLARKLDLDAELCLMKTNRKFAHRFRTMETLAEEQNTTLTELDIDAQEALYQQAKALLKNKS